MENDFLGSSQDSGNQFKYYFSRSNFPLVVHIPTNRYFFKHWEVKPAAPIAIVVIVIFGNLVFYYSVGRYILSETIMISKIVLLLILSTLFLISYLNTVFFDPGFIPYNWYLTKKNSYSWEEQINNIAFTEDHFKIQANAFDKPPNCSFSKTYGRYIIRGDHICGFVANWIGKRNHKQFFLMQLYGFLLSLTFIIFYLIPSTKESLRYDYLQSIAMFLQFVFLLYTIGNGLTTYVDFLNGSTSIQQWKGIHVVKKPWKEQMREVFGNDSMIFWLLPTYPVF